MLPYDCFLVTGFHPSSLSIALRYSVSICRGARLTYSSAALLFSAWRLSRYSITCSTEGSPSPPGNLADRFVQTTASISFSCAHSAMDVQIVSLFVLGGHRPIFRSSYSGGMPSRSRRDVTAAASDDVDSQHHKVRTGAAVVDKTRVIRPSRDLRRNSTGKNGPSVNHLPLIGRPRGSQISEPQPMHAIFILLSMRTKARRGRFASRGPNRSDQLSDCRRLRDCSEAIHTSDSHTMSKSCLLGGQKFQSGPEVRPSLALDTKSLSKAFCSRCSQHVLIEQDFVLLNSQSLTEP